MFAQLRRGVTDAGGRGAELDRGTDHFDLLPGPVRYLRKGAQSTRLGIAHVPDGRGTFLDLTTEENLRLGGITRGGKRALAGDMDRMYGYFPRLQERRAQQAGTLSGGEQQMLAVGRAFVSGRQVMLLDEPSMGLSPLLMTRVFESLREINREGTSILLVEQNARMALTFAQRAYVIENGKIVLQGESKALLDDPEVKKAYLGG